MKSFAIGKPPHPRSRLGGLWRFGVVVFGIACLLAPVPALASTSFRPFLGQWGSSGGGDGQFSRAYRVAVDSAGNVFVADSNNNRIEKFSPTGTFLSELGNSGPVEARLNHPWGMAFDATGNLYVADAGNNCVRKLSPDGSLLATWGSFGGGAGQFNCPLDAAVDTGGCVYVVDLHNNRIQKLSASGVFVTQWGSLGAGDGQFNSPGGVAVDKAGNVLVADSNNNRIEKFSPTGQYISQWATGNYPRDTAVDGAGNVYVVDSLDDTIQEFSSNGTLLSTWGSRGSAPSQFRGADGVAVDAVSGDVYVADGGNDRVEKFSRNDLPASADATAPLTSADANGSMVGWALIQIRASDQVPGSGIAHAYYRLDGGNLTEGTSAFTSALGNHSLEFWSVDNAGNAEIPHKTVSFSVAAYPQTVPPLPIMYEFADEGCSQVRAAEPAVERLREEYAGRVNIVRLDSTSPLMSKWNITGVPAFVIVDSSGVVKFAPSAGWGGGVESELRWHMALVLDATPPTTACDAVAVYAGSATVHLSATDNAGGSGVVSTQYRLDDGTETTGTLVSSRGLGSHTLEFWSVDAAGNVETPHKFAMFVITDTTPPKTTSNAVTYYANSATIRLTASDNSGGSGIAHTYYRLNGAAQVASSTVRVSKAGTYSLVYSSVDASGNVEAAHTVRFTVIAKPSSGGTPSTPASIPTLTRGKSFAVYGYIVKHTAGVYPVTLQFYRYQSGHWVLRKTSTGKASNMLTFSKYSRSTSVPYSGKWRVRAQHKVGTKYLYSGYRTFTAK